MDYEKMLYELIIHFLNHEGTDHLSFTIPENLTEAEAKALTEIRDKARREYDRRIFDEEAPTPSTATP